MASESIQIPLDQLRRALDLAIRHIEASAEPTVMLREDLFWSVSADEVYDVGAEPQALTVGQATP
ncbi:hypothetical protein [Streptomyces sp. NPDC059651]|uniref:hypothetical protein n=1 Tax=unclassified Streptomyces TaxID=2593676 RepID=UPI00367D2D9A